MYASFMYIEWSKTFSRLVFNVNIEKCNCKYIKASNINFSSQPKNKSVHSCIRTFFKVCINLSKIKITLVDMIANLFSIIFAENHLTKIQNINIKLIYILL